eukprot:jgi/Chrzof1/2942/Cz12g05090.t1
MVITRLCAAAGVLLVIKGFPAILLLLGLGEVAALQPYQQKCYANEMLCDSRLCAFTGVTHIAWSLPALGENYYIAGASLHSFMMFVPLLVVGRPGPNWGTSIACFITGPLVATAITWSSASASKFEWAAIWCFFSVYQCALLLGVEVSYEFGYKDRSQRLLLGTFGKWFVEPDTKIKAVKAK